MSYNLEHNVSEQQTSSGGDEELVRRVRAFYSLMGFTNDDDKSGRVLDEPFIDALVRINSKDLGSDEQCVICSTEFVEDKYPLVVQLPCPGRHRFDLQCVRPWLEMKGTCPMCRYDFVKSKETAEQQRANIEADDEEEEWDDMYS